MNNTLLFAGLLMLFLLYQIAEANGQNVIKFPGKPFSIFLLYLLVLFIAGWVARWQNAPGFSVYGMGLHRGWWQNYLFGLGLGMVVQGIFEYISTRLGIRQAANIRFSWRLLLAGILWALFTNFPAAAAEDIITRGYLRRFMTNSPLLLFMITSALLYTFNHIIRLLTRPITDWYHLPFLGLTLAYALYQTGSLWYVIGLHQSGNVIYYLMHQLMDVSNTIQVEKRIIYGIASELVFFLIVIICTPLAKINPIVY